MKSRTTGFILVTAISIVVFTMPVQAYDEVGGIINLDTTWTNSDTILVTDIVTINEGATLTIEAGTVVLFNYSLRVQNYGSLYIAGNSANRVTLTSFYETNGTPYRGDWYGITAEDGSFTSIRFADIRYVVLGLYTSSSNADIFASAIENYSSYGLYVLGKYSGVPDTIQINHSVISQRFTNKTIGTAIYADRAVQINISNSEISETRIGCDFRSCNTSAVEFMLDSCNFMIILSEGFLHFTGF